jgi:hypothetical protein
MSLRSEVRQIGGNDQPTDSEPLWLFREPLAANQRSLAAERLPHNPLLQGEHQIVDAHQIINGCRIFTSDRPR